MRALLILVAASAVGAAPVPAAAVDRDQLAFVGNPVTTVQGGFVVGRDDRRFNRRRNSDGTVIVYDRDYQGDTLWKSDSFNDWWHDRPERAYPRWMVSNQSCEKQWYQGDVLRC